MAKKIVSTSFVRISHRMNNDEKRLFRILFERAMTELDLKKEHTISPDDLLKLWNRNPQSKNWNRHSGIWV